MRKTRRKLRGQLGKSPSVHKREPLGR
jgi:hypothetical protein